MRLTTIAAAILAALLVAAPASAGLMWISDDADQEDRGARARDREEAEENTYEAGTEALDSSEWRVAAEHFRQVEKMNMSNAPGALYWLAYAQHRMAQRSEALATLVELQKRYPKSRWTSDAKALEVEIRQSAGQRVAPEAVDGDELKLIAVNALMHTDSERAVPILEKIIANPQQPPKVKEKALFVLSQSNSPRATELIARIARDGSNPDLQARAIKNLGILGGESSRKLLADIYASSTDVKIKKSIIKSYLISQDRTRLLTLAKTETNQDLRMDAVQQLGILGAKNELAELYQTEPSTEIRKKIIQSMFIGGNAEKLAEIARGEKVLELRVAAIKNLGLLGGSSTGPMLVGFYEDQNPEIRRAVIQGLFLQGNSKALVALARKEKDPTLKKKLVSQLAIMGGKDAQDYMMELLNE